jgi:hypothetical protein
MVVRADAHDLVDKADRSRDDPIERRIDEQEVESFPASDPHSDWAGPPT